jgi:hypothetical protein
MDPLVSGSDRAGCVTEVVPIPAGHRLKWFHRRERLSESTDAAPSRTPGRFATNLPTDAEAVGV